MRIGILTFHSAHNYGAVLQAYALKSVLKKLYKDIDVNIIDYRNQAIDRKYKFKQELIIGKKDVLFPWRWKKIKERRDNIDYSQESWEKQWNNFEEFINAELLNRENNKNDFNNYDIIIFGSDQIWEKKATNGLDQVYFGGFQFAGQKISYAASMTGEVIEKEDEAFFKKYLLDFQALSVREQSIADSLACLLKKNVKVVLDPTLLLEKSDYNNIIDYNFVPCKKNYILAYYVSENQEMSLYVNKLAKKNNLEVVEIHYYDLPDLNKENQYSDLGPRQFLKCYAEASFVVTNSFHGTVFSIIFEKQFYCYYHNNNRVESLLKMFNIQDANRMKDGSLEIKKYIDYKVVSDRKNQLKEESINFLKNSIGDN